MGLAEVAWGVGVMAAAESVEVELEALQVIEVEPEARMQARVGVHPAGAAMAAVVRVVAAEVEVG